MFYCSNDFAVNSIDNNTYMASLIYELCCDSIPFPTKSLIQIPSPVQTQNINAVNSIKRFFVQHIIP